MQAWQKTFVTTEAAEGEGLQRSVSFGKQQGMPITIPKILEIEECICSPVYGIKGTNFPALSG